MAKFSQYSDIDLDFTINPITGDINHKFDEEAVKESVRNLVFTQFYERPRRPSLGSNVYNLIFENMTPLTAMIMERSIKETINNFEPRAEVMVVNVSPNPAQNLYSVQIVFNVVNQPDPVTLDIFIERSL